MVNRPKLEIPKTKIEVWHDIVSIAILAGTFIYLYFVWPTLPERIPIHFNGLGEVDGWGSKSSLFMLPIISVVLYVGLTILGYYPHTFNYLREITEENAYRQYVIARMMISWMKIEIMVLLSYIEWQVVFGNMKGLGGGFLPVILIVFLGTIMFYAVRSLRTP
ncbi:DUF1648 domain-containing protein [Aneurinibacillus aneurinilyticus]|jgi:uncharacterized membrane protein|uniref:DUF1648 domain-containing protein n=1 Tax=Aneurinibacillus aneurinilyticus TaxID=1391 RepID=A0A848CKM6_ANEAE|nr:DUF1648 domain-containing protein [Aneurinibacillus aneurinilyticus]MCI1696701.1 DUF1648 domain-containing protein [Aneurinibacillus aneurinilyticus]NME97854.1 DUF1648 domain-containing protein [Aneurinibacillus aneurinilyticus]